MLKFFATMKSATRPLPSGVSSTVREGEKLSQPVLKKGRFDNPWPEWRKYNVGGWDFIKAGGMWPAKVPSKSVLNRELPIHTPSWDKIQEPNEDDLQITWVGHSSFLVQMEGVNFLTDPVWSDRCSPSQYVGPKRYRKVPCTIAELPKLDFVVLSHDHYDHLDYKAVKKIGNNAKWIIPYGLGRFFDSCGVINYIELQWWDKYEFSKDLDIIFTPAMHWSSRTIGDARTSLWGSYAVKGKKKSVWFGGDTGYCDTFKEIGDKFGPFDLAFIPIGAYEPRKLMRAQHINPDEAVQIHLDLKAKKSVGMHWGTFVLTSEPVLQPRDDLETAKTDHDVDEDSFVTVFHGETTTII